ncbi:MAG: glycosyltransferase family 4 protein [Candidatus Eisenbacteria bacterium]|nr:glycosyltransferase family 4 protein [Candidatus Eisenbacteria bacterium]
MVGSADGIGSSRMIGSLKVKVMHVRASNFFGGPEKQIVEHLKLLRGTQIEALLCSFYENGKETELARRANALGIRSFSVPCISAYDPTQVLRLRKLFKTQRPELICTHDYRSTFLCLVGRAGLPARQIAFWRGTTRENLKVALYYKLENWLLRRMDHVVVVSREQQNVLASRGLPENKVSLVPNAVSVEREKQDDRAEHRRNEGEAAQCDVPADAGSDDGLSALFSKFCGKTIIATAGRLSPEKGQEYLIEAMPRVLASEKEAVLLVFGDGPLRDHLARLAEKIGCADSIHFLGHVPGLASSLRNVDLFVLPSLTEGLPNVLLEALAAATPVIATAVGGVPEIVVNGETGILVSPGESGQLARAITELLSDPGLARAMGQAGQEAIRRSHSFEGQLRLLTEVYTKTLAVERA